MEEFARSAGKGAVRFDFMLARIRRGYMGGVEDYFGPPSEEFRKAAGRLVQQAPIGRMDRPRGQKCRGCTSRPE